MDSLITKSLPRLARFFSGIFNSRALASVPAGASSPLSFGTPVPVQSSLSSAAVWACIRIVSQSIACLPGHIFEETDTGKVKARNQPLYRLLSKQPNPLMTFTQLIQTTVMNLLVWGNAFWLPRMVEGEIVAIVPIDPAYVRLVFNTDGSFVYRIFDAGKQFDLAPLELLHFRIFSLDGIVGLSPLDYHRLTLDSESMAQMYAASIFANGGRPSGVLEYPGTLKKEQVDAIRTAWTSLHSGPASGGSIAILEGGTKYNAISVPLQMLEYIDQQRFSVEQVARIFGVPSHMIGAAQQPTYASVEQAGIEFSMYTQQPIVTGIEQTVETNLLRPPFIYRLNLNAFQRADITSRYRAYAMGRQWGWFSVNDIRELEEMNRIGPEGDIYLQPLNMAPAADPAVELPTAQVDAANATDQAAALAAERAR